MSNKQKKNIGTLTFSVQGTDFGNMKNSCFESLPITDRPKDLMDRIICRPKKFESMESLWYEEERLATFIGWPIKFISEKELASEGFYYLRTKDHCACAFCRGIIGAWEIGDTPRDEHKRHFPHCPFVQGKVTANVPLSQGRILLKICQDNITTDESKAGLFRSEDVCGTGKGQTSLGSVPETTSLVLDHDIKSEFSLKNLGFKEYCGPKRKDYITAEERLRSYRHWPEKVSQKPAEMAEAGFFYCGLSDHVRCFHCGNGLRNWEEDDLPWVEHARWYPDCNFVLLQKGIDFVDKVRRERPPYIPFCSNESGPSVSATASTRNYSPKLSDEELNHLMQLHIMKEVLQMGFSENVVKIALLRKLSQTGLPFFYMETAIEAILAVMDEETKRTLKGCEEITSQARKMAGIESNSDQGHEDSTLNDNTEQSSLPPLPNKNRSCMPASESNLPIAPFSVQRASPPLRASTPTSHESSSQILTIGASSGNRDNENNQSVPTSVSDNPEAANSMSSGQLTGSSSIGTSTRTFPLLNEADEIIEEAAKQLALPINVISRGSNSSSESSQDSGICKDSDMENLSSGSDEEKEEKVSKSKKNDMEAEDLAMELEKIKETRTCRVCMDKEMDVVFLPCTHMVACSTCAVALSSCPICRRDIQYAFKPIIS